MGPLSRVSARVRVKMERVQVYVAHVLGLSSVEKLFKCEATSSSTWTQTTQGDVCDRPVLAHGQDFRCWFTVRISRCGDESESES